jgi:hypothetical protein
MNAVGAGMPEQTMPIRKENRRRYPPNWPAVSRFIRFERADGRCECVSECGLHAHHGRCKERHGEAAQWAKGKVVLTVAHLNHRPEDCDHDNLKAMCQRCHLRYDREHHGETRKRGKSHRAARHG